MEFSKRNGITAGAGLAVMALSGWLVGCNAMAAVLCMLLFGLLAFVKLELSEKVPWIWTALLVLPGALLSTFSIQYLLLTSEDFVKTTFDKWKLNFLCVIAVYLLVLMISIRPRISCIVAHSLLMVFAFIDYFVYMFRQVEFSFADIRAVGTGLSVASNYHFQITPQAVYVLFWSGIYILLVIKCEIRFVQKLPARIMAMMLVVLAALPVGLRLEAYNTETWEMKGTYRNGYVLNFILQIRDSFVRAPKGYSADRIRELEKSYSEKTEEAEQVNVKDPVIIVIMNESFADLTTIADFETNMPLTPFLDSLEKNTTKGYALSSVFGAKTPNSEWEYQTGNSMAFLPQGAVVYQQYMNEQPHSIVSTLKKLDYTCVAMHPYYSSGWSRNAVYPKLGYDEMHFIEDFDQTKILREYITDQALYDKIIDRYEERKPGEKLFLLAVTMQNHGGYTETYDNFEERYYKAGRSYTDVNQYLSLVNESDRAMEHLVKYFEKVDQPVEIVFFGDHQPSLNSYFYRMLNGKGLSGLTLSELEDLYKVPFYIWTNYETGEEEIPVTSLNFLSTLTLQRAGIALPPWNRFLAEMMKVIPAVNSRGYFSEEFQMFRHVEDATGKEKELLDQYEMLQYNNMFDRKNRSPVFFPGQD